VKDVCATERLEIHLADESYVDRLLTYAMEQREHHQDRNPIRSESFYTIEEQKKRLQVEPDSLTKYCVFKKDDDARMIGEINFSNTIRGVLCSCFVSYSIHHKEEGNGYATEALKAIIPEFFKHSGLHRMAAHIMPWNKASIRVVEKCGFKKEGYFRKYLKINGNWEDHLAYALLR